MFSKNLSSSSIRIRSGAGARRSDSEVVELPDPIRGHVDPGADDGKIDGRRLTAAYIAGRSRTRWGYGRRLAIPAGATLSWSCAGRRRRAGAGFDSGRSTGGVMALTRLATIGTSGVDVRNSGIGANKETARNVGGGALLGAIIGGVIGGGDAALAGAAAGAAVGAGAQILTKGRRVSVPAEALLTYRLQSDINLDVKDAGYDREGNHYHQFNR